MKTYISVSFILASFTATTQACTSYKVGCCNIFGRDCDGPCWNAGCSTVCGSGDYAGTPVACPNSNNDHYNCCPSGSQCRSSCDASTTSCCCDPNDKQIIGISNLQYDLDNISEQGDPSAIRTTIQNQGVNYGPSQSAAPSLNIKLSSTQTTSWSFSSTTKISASATFKAGVPFVGSGKVTVGAEEDIAVGKTGSQTQQLDLTINTGQDYLQPFSRQVWEFSSDMKIFQIPFTATATTQDDCGNQGTMQVTGTAQVSGFAAIIEGEYLKIAGPVIPVECRSPFNTPVEEQASIQWCPAGTSTDCSDHVLCVREGLTGTCCAPGQLDGCCAMAAAHEPSCNIYAAQDIICPSPYGTFDPCCSAQGRSLFNATIPTENQQVHFEAVVIRQGQGSVVSVHSPVVMERAKTEMNLVFQTEKAHKLRR